MCGSVGEGGMRGRTIDPFSSIHSAARIYIHIHIHMRTIVYRVLNHWLQRFFMYLDRFHVKHSSLKV